MRQIHTTSWLRSSPPLLLFAVLIVLASQAAWAQANRASITGTVTDTSGAVVQDVEVTATNTGTKVPAKTVSNQDGIYVIPNLFPGQYSVEFKKDGTGGLSICRGYFAARSGRVCGSSCGGV